MPTNRRTFLSNSMALAGGMLMDPFQSVEKDKVNFHIPATFSLKFLATNWGFEGTWDQFCEKAKKAGYDGFEAWAPGDEKGRNEMQAAAAKYGLSYGLLVGAGDSDPTKNKTALEAQMKFALPMKPLFFNCHSGKDYFSQEQAIGILDMANKIGKAAGIPVYHETHRGRICYAAPVTKALMEKLPDLRLTLDISHWCCVHESLLEEQTETVAMALSRTDHIHSRVGHQEGPQVTDPRAPEWASALKAHLAWWDKVVEMKVKAGQGLTVLTEFGPPNYLPTVPYTLQPLADQWGINVYMKDLLKARYAGK
jgi:Xylose isomerase-like TIM barrel